MLRTLSLAALAAAVAASAPAQAQAQRADAVVVRVETGRASFERPLRIDPGTVERTRPVWTPEGVALAAPEAVLRQAGIAPEDHGIPVYDAESGAWYATAQGCLVRLAGDGTLPVVLEGMQALDVDVRERRGLAVTREQDDRIVLHRWTGTQVSRRVLLQGPQFFNPRFSPDGGKVLVAESRATGGHVWLVGLDGKAEDLGQGYGASWHPDGRRVIFTRLEHDGETILASDVLLLDLATRSQTRLAHTAGPVAVEPAVSPDGRSVAFADPTRREVYVAAMPQEVR
jgi:hypothetical protein